MTVVRTMPGAGTLLAPTGEPPANSAAGVRGFGVATDVPDTSELRPLHQERSYPRIEAPSPGTTLPAPFRAKGPDRAVGYPVAFTLSQAEYELEPPNLGVQSRAQREDSGFPLGRHEPQALGSTRAVVRPVPGAWDAGYRGGAGGMP